jgi:murein DD-endopeptidase MepM/ murein hydrolase activator NlpD
MIFEGDQMSRGKDKGGPHKKAHLVAYLSLIWALTGCNGENVGRTIEAPIQGVVPATGVVMTTHGQYMGRFDFHDGYDIQGAIGTPVAAAFSGVVVEADNVGNKSGSLGKYAVVQINGTRLGCAVLSAHLDTVLVNVGQQVEAGQIIGQMGDSGLAGLFPAHLHLSGECAGYSVDLANNIPALRGVKPGGRVERSGK